MILDSGGRKVRVPGRGKFAWLAGVPFSIDGSNRTGRFRRSSLLNTATIIGAEQRQHQSTGLGAIPSPHRNTAAVSDGRIWEIESFFVLLTFGNPSDYDEENSSSS